MRKVETKEYQTFEAYKEFEEVFCAFGQMVLFAMAQFPPTTRDTIIRNFIARALVMLRGMFQLWEIEDYQDCLKTGLSSSNIILETRSEVIANIIADFFLTFGRILQSRRQE
jgi:hypothetical protein